MVSGLPNESTRCYLNVIIQAARACAPISDFDYIQDELYKTLHLEDGPQDAHETWLRLVDHLEKTRYPKETFYGLQREICISKSEKEDRNVIFGCIHVSGSDLSYGGDEYVPTDAGFTLKRTTVLDVPKIMVYVFDSNHEVNFPDTNAYGKKLVALIVHGLGHYIALVRYDDDWFLTNDMMIEKISNFGYTMRAYMAFYV